MRKSCLQAGTKISDREFVFDVKHWAFGQLRTAAHVCMFPATKARFANKVPCPRNGNHISIGGYIQGRVSASGDDDPVLRIPVEVEEISFLAADVSSAPSPVKGELS
jgi:hypothetical protein